MKRTLGGRNGAFEARAGSEALAAIGVDAGKLGAMKPEEQLYAVAKGITNVADSSSQLAIATALFGDNAEQLLPALRQLASIPPPKWWSSNNPQTTEQLAGMGNALSIAGGWVKSTVMDAIASPATSMALLAGPLAPVGGALAWLQGSGYLLSGGKTGTETGGDKRLFGLSTGQFATAAEANSQASVSMLLESLFPAGQVMEVIATETKRTADILAGMDAKGKGVDKERL
jgi:hypothetical protein